MRAAVSAVHPTPGRWLSSVPVTPPTRGRHRLVVLLVVAAATTAAVLVSAGVGDAVVRHPSTGHAGVVGTSSSAPVGAPVVADPTPAGVPSSASPQPTAAQPTAVAPTAVPSSTAPPAGASAAGTSPSGVPATRPGAGASRSTSGSAASRSAATPAAPVPTTAARPAPPAAGAAVGTGEQGTTSAPGSDLPGWRLVLSEDFTTDAALGHFAAVYPGWAGYDGWRDTSRGLGRPVAQQGEYDSATTTTVHDGVVDEHLHTAGSTPQVMALTPPLGSAADSPYGRYAVRFKADEIPGYKMAWLLWPTSDDWHQGEVDFPEGDLGGPVEGYAHDVTGDPSRNAWSVQTGTSMTDWHTAVIEWSPGRLTYTLDDRSWTTTDTSAIPTDPMHWILQTETQLSAQAPPAGSAGHVYVDWVAAWTRE